MAHGYPIRSVARLTGISADTLRAWERRYQAVVPERGNRGRLYRESDIERLRQLDTLVRRGHAIGTIAHLKHRQLQTLIDEPAPLQQTPSRPRLDLSELITALVHFDLPALDAALNRFALLMAPPHLVADAVLPLLRELGEQWQAGTLTPAQEHLVSGIVRTVLGGLLRTAPAATGPLVVFATTEGEQHELGLLAAAVLAAHEGLRVMYLGPDLPASDIARSATAAGATAIVLSATMTDAHAHVAEIRQLAPDAHLFIGGPGVRHVPGAERTHFVNDVTALPAALRQRLR